MEGKDKIMAISILTVAILISVILGIGSTNMSGHEVVVFPFLEALFLVLYTICLIAVSIKSYRKNNKTTGKIILLSSLVAVMLGGLIYTCIDYYL
ncbi:hypothetical protein Q0590_33810 [Rhodocytophaga aerolata]|uniref:Uncharacterized protein n=1 Tax=Rhodocytophaga aerolata TaxID=455078 RepID=A0ABT8RJX7_9BACT|nr:hypothetical protein [Rhodocytophaga aerolata]MDO1451300.1 hypothetical protein [Rhodocytophaga aerolata]